jgi:hypothetical protein
MIDAVIDDLDDHGFIERCLPKAVVLLLKARRNAIRLNRFHVNLKNAPPYESWQRAGRPVPPPHIVKELAVREYQRRYRMETLVETGTYLGEMVSAQKDHFRRILSVELDHQLYEDAAKLFSRYPHIQILQGDSGEVLNRVVPNLAEMALFWLDGHYSTGRTARGKKETPILEELDAILRGGYTHVMLIDDARCFTGTGDYPTLEQLSSFIKARNASYVITVEDDIIRAVVD